MNTENSLAQVSTIVENKNGFLYELVKNKALFIMALPAIIFVVINNYIPMLGLVMAFKNISFAKGIINSPWVGLDNFKFLFSSPDSWTITRNTVLYNLVFIVLGLIIPIAFAICLNEIKSVTKSKFYQSAMLLPNFLSYVVISFLVYALLSPSGGFINSNILSIFGIQPVSWYEEAKYWPVILVVVNTWRSAGYGAVVYLAAIAGIDPEYYEAATIDGASKWQQIKNITIPSLKPLMITLTVMALGKIFNSDFGLFYQVTLNSGLLYDTTRTIDVYVFNAVKSDVSMGAAAGFYQSIVGFVLVLLSNYAIGKIDNENKLF